MNCKYCGEPMGDEQTNCPACGADNASDAVEETVTDDTVTEDNGAEEIVEADGFDLTDAFSAEEGEEAADDASEEPLIVATEEDLLGPEVPQKPKKPGKGLLIGLCVVALAAVAALVLALTGVLGDVFNKGGEDGADPTEVVMVDKDGVFVPHDFTKANDQITEEEANAVVAKAGSAELTNTQLSYYYWQQYYNLYSQYGQYISYILDTTKSLAEQMVDDTHSWQDTVLQQAFGAFRQTTAMAAAAEKAGYKLDETYESYLTSMKDGMDADAANNGFETGDELLQSLYGPYATVDSYIEYARTVYTAMSYLESLNAEITYTPEDITAYFEEHTEDYAEQAFSKDDPNMVNVRHILITPTADEGAELDENGAPVLTDANWAAAEAQANEIYEQWKAGDATEESFAALATENSTDPGSASNGGLYEDVYPGQMVPTFNDWCFDSARKTGDTGIVKTDYGYHIIYFSSVGEHPYWYTVAETDLKTSLQKEIVDDVVNKVKFKSDLTKVVLSESDLTKQG